MTMLLFILKILLAHLAGDLVFQSTKCVEDRKKNGYRSKYLYIHILIHFLLLVLFFANELQVVSGYVILIVVSHCLIDLCEIYFEYTSGCSQLVLFSRDQLLDLVVLFGVGLLCFPGLSMETIMEVEKRMWYVIACLLITSVTSIGVKMFFRK